MSTRNLRLGASLNLRLGASIAFLALLAFETRSEGGSEVSTQVAAAPRLRFVTESSPLGLPESIEDPADNPVNPERLALGQSLFFDPILSQDSTVSCGSCHRPDHGFSSPEAFPQGVLGRRPGRHAPTLFNRALGKSFMWDGRLPNLEAQVLEPIVNELEMALPIEEALRRLDESQTYRKLFDQAYDDGLTKKNLAKALAGFVRRIRIGNSPVDHFREGRTRSLSTAAKTGLWIFESKGQCWRCHNGANFTDEKFHNTGIGATKGEPEPSRFAVTGDPKDLGRFKTPTLRGLAFTPPYMHNGSLATLEDVVEFYRRGGEKNRNLAPEMASISLTDQDVKNLVAFLRALSKTEGI